jgi:hypothetical protein
LDQLDVDDLHGPSETPDCAGTTVPPARTSLA